jgi:hypothetical protein
MLESGEVKSLKKIAEPEKIDDSYVSRMINPTCFAPEIVAASLLDNEFPEHITLFELEVR